MSKKPLRGVSLFSSAGIGEAFFDQAGISIAVANELIADRARLYSRLYKDTHMVTGDILDDEVFDEILDKAGDKVDFLIATPPCQGLSVAGKNRDQRTMAQDERNHLVFRIIEFISIKHPDYILIENVPNFLRLKLPFRGGLHTLEEILTIMFGDTYHIEARVLDASDYGIPQRRQRALIKLYKPQRRWEWPAPSQTRTTVQEAIGHLPSLESSQRSNLPWHFARRHSPSHVEWMRHTPTGASAFENQTHYPRKADGRRISSYMTTYRRIRWDEPAPTITIRNDAISSQLNVHPGRPLPDGLYSDARVLTPHELMLLSSLPEDWPVPEDTPEILLRQCIGESVPPLLLKKIVSTIA